MTDIESVALDRFQQAQKRLNLVKAHAHEIVGVNREQVHMVTESFGQPGTYIITVHRDGRVEHHNWTPPPEDTVIVQPDPEKVLDELVADIDEVEGEGDSDVQEQTVPVVEVAKVVEGSVGDPVSEAAESPATETPAAPEAPVKRGRGRPSKAK